MASYFLVSRNKRLANHITDIPVSLGISISNIFISCSAIAIRWRWIVRWTLILVNGMQGCRWRSGFSRQFHGFSLTFRPWPFSMYFCYNSHPVNWRSVFINMVFLFLFWTFFHFRWLPWLFYFLLIYVRGFNFSTREKCFSTTWRICFRFLFIFSKIKIVNCKSLQSWQLTSSGSSGLVRGLAL